MKARNALSWRYSNSGFSLVEIVVAMFFVSMAIALVAGLGQQVANLTKRSTQAGAVLELRSMVSSIARNTDEWIDKMRSSVAVNGVYAGCIPDPNLNVTTFACPALDASLLTQDLELAKIVGSDFHVASSPIVNSRGELIAGTVENPVYLTNEGRRCEDDNSRNCGLKSSGYFLRTNPIANQDPGSIKFVIKIERNARYVQGNMTPMKPQYMTVDIGKDWKSLDVATTMTCPAGTIKIGYLSNGSASCLNPSDPCPAPNSYPIGVSIAGKTICKSIPQDCGTSASGVALNSTGDDLTCSSNITPCGKNNIFLGYFGGSGEPMCSGPEIKCSSGQLQVGILIADGKMSAECATPPKSCADTNARLSYDGEKFICENATLAFGCAENEYMKGMNANGTPKCEPIQRDLATDKLNCADGLIMTGLNPDGSVKCKPEINWLAPVSFKAVTVPNSILTATTTTPIPYKLCVQSYVYVEESGRCFMSRNTDGTWKLDAAAPHIHLYVGCEMICFK